MTITLQVRAGAAAILHPELIPQCGGTHVKRQIVTTAFFLLCGTTAFPQSAPTFGAWSTYKVGAQTGKEMTLLQTTSLQQGEDAQGQPVVLKLDALCRKGKLYRIALETAAPVHERAMNFSGAVPTTPVAFSADGKSTQIQSWAVLDSGHTISPYSESGQGKTNRLWIESLVGTRNVTLHFEGGVGEDQVQVSFDTEGIAEALASAGCSY